MPIRFLLSILLMVSLASCTSMRQLRYFNDLPDSAVINLPPMPQEQRIIQRGDRLQITIAGENEEASRFFNTYGGQPTSGGNAGGGGGGGMMGGGANTEMGGFLVDPDGNLQWPLIGKINVLGMTQWQLRDSLIMLSSKYLKNPLVNVRFMQLQYFVLGLDMGSVQRISPQRTSIIDALATQGGLPINVKRHDIQVYRDYNGERKIFKLDLRKKDILYNSEQFFVKHNDVIIVQPRTLSFFRQEVGAIVGLVSLLLGITTLIITRT